MNRMVALLSIGVFAGTVPRATSAQQAAKPNDAMAIRPDSVDDATRAGVLAARDAIWRAWFANDTAALGRLLPRSTTAGEPGTWDSRGEIVARQILPVLRKLDAEAFVRAAVQAREKSFHDRPRLQLHRPQPRDDGGIQEPQVAGRGGGRHGYIPLRGIGTASRSRSTRLSAVTRSDSA